jgi:hypothetical protein
MGAYQARKLLVYRLHLALYFFSILSLAVFCKRQTATLTWIIHNNNNPRYDR